MNVGRIMRESKSNNVLKTAAVVATAGAAVVTAAIGIKQVIAPGKPIFKKKNGVEDNMEGFVDEFEDIPENGSAPESALNK